MRLSKQSGIIISLLFFEACAPAYRFTIGDLSAVPETNPAIKDLILSVDFLVDKRAVSGENQPSFEERKKPFVDNKWICLNSERNYRDPLEESLAKITATYMKKTLLFQNVVYGKAHLADYHLSASLKHYRAIQKIPHGAQDQAIEDVAVGVALSLFGIMYYVDRPSDYTTPGEIYLELDDVRLYEKENNLIADLGNTTYQFEGDLPADIECWCAF